jgi:4,5-dihydroxyphthalate decarboxylase
VAITIALEESDLTRALILGRVGDDRLDLETVVVRTEERHERMIARSEFDACEFSVAQYLALRDRGQCDFTAIPVFPRRMFGQHLLFARADAGIARPQDLAGRRVLLSRYHNSLALWLRGYLEHEHKVSPGDIHWIRLRREAIDVDVPSNIQTSDAPPGSSVETLLASGLVDAVMTPNIPQAFLEGSALITRVFSDVWRVEAEYFARTHDFPIMHLVVVKNALLAAHPWVADALVDAFDRSKRAYFEYASQPFRLGLVFGGAQKEEECALLGPDPWPYNVSQNLVSLSLLTKYACEQGLTSRLLEPAELFAPRLRPA